MTNKAAKQLRKKREMSGEAAPRVKFFGLTKLKPFLAPYKWMFLVMILGTIIVGVLNTVMPLFQEYAINNFIAHNTTEGLLPFILLYVLCLAVVMVIEAYLAHGHAFGRGEQGGEPVVVAGVQVFEVGRVKPRRKVYGGVFFRLHCREGG